MKASKVLNVIISIILWVVIIVAALFAFTTLATRDSNKVANLFGFTPLTVQSDSMVPTFSAGDMIIIKKCNTADLKEGDIITFHTIIQNQYVLNTHRIASIVSNGSVRSYTTKGDNNLIEDSHIIADGDIVGKYVTKIGGFGKVIDFLSSSMGFLICIVLPMLLFFAYEVYHLIVISIQLKKATAIEAAQEAQAANADVDAKLAEMQRLAAEAEAKLAEARRLTEEKKSE
ncbi:MAG: signal peptidase I [Clostridia bacterium]|nr:signal peptidase I [Clostridia bacterium]